MNLPLKFLFAALLFLKLPGYSQLGPAGVGDSDDNALWLAPEGLSGIENGGRVNVWNDLSGNDNHAYAPDYLLNGGLASNTTPTLIANGINGERSVNFNRGNQQYLQVPDADNLDGNSGLTLFIVARFTSVNDPSGLVSKRLHHNTNSNYAYSVFTHTSNRIHADIASTSNRFDANKTILAGESNLVTLHFDGTENNDQARLFNEGEENGSQNINSISSIPNSNQDLRIGMLNGNSSSFLNGDIAEIIQYNRALNEVEQLIVETYLGHKYNMDVEDNYHDSDGIYTHAVAGFGRVGGAQHQISQGRSPIRVSPNGNLGNNRFVFWGHNGAPLNETNTTDLTPDMEGRLSRVWKFSKRGNHRRMNISFSLDSLGGVNPLALRLMVSGNGNNFTNNTITYPGIVNGNYIEFNAISIDDGDILTIGTASFSISPLPIELIDFNVVNQDKTVAVSWKTASELNNEYFSVMRSRDPGAGWEEIAQINGAGNSTSEQSYLYHDTEPLSGTSYYRLKQTDFNGDSEAFDIVSIYREEKSPDQIELVIYPNPATEKLSLFAEKDLAGAEIQIYDLQGRIIRMENLSFSREINVGSFPPGSYILKVLLGEEIFSTRFVKQSI